MCCYVQLLSAVTMTIQNVVFGNRLVGCIKVHSVTIARGNFDIIR